MKSKIGLMVAGIFIGLALVLAAWNYFQGSYTYQGSLIDPPMPAADFELTDQNGTTFRLSEQQGKVVLIFFGYTHCPDVCPVTLAEFSQIKKRLGDLAGNVEFVFITVDPERDTQEQIKKYVANFDPQFIGLTGSQAQMEPIWKDYFIYQQKQESGSAAGYLVDHTARVYAIDAQGNLRLTYPFGMETTKLVQDVEHLVREN